MNIKIVKKIERPLLFRTELQAELHFDGATPNRTDIKKTLASALKVAEDTVAVRSVKTQFGKRSANFVANLYKTKEDLMKYELPIFLAKGQPKKSEASEIEKAISERAQKPSVSDTKTEAKKEEKK